MEHSIKRKERIRLGQGYIRSLEKETRGGIYRYKMVVYKKKRVCRVQVFKFIGCEGFREMVVGVTKARD